MNTIIQNNEEIWKLLERSDAIFSDFSTDHIIDLETEEEYYVIVFLCGSKNFIAFKTTGHHQDKNALPAFLTFVQQNNMLLPDPVLNKALGIIENRMHSRDNSLFYFDAH